MLAAFLLGGPSGSWAQTPQVPFERLLIELRPEYDRPSVLVIYWIWLSADTPLPARVSVPIPAAVGEPFAIGIGLGEGAAPRAAPYQRQVDGEWATISFESDSLIAQVEFYAELTVQDEARTYAFTWPGGVPVEAMAYMVQHPVGSSGMQIEPAPESTYEGRDRLTYSQLEIGSQAVDSPLTIRVTYSKAGTGLSIDALQPVAPLLASPGAGSGLSRPWVVPVLAGSGLLLLIGAGLWLWRARGEPRRRAQRPRRRRPRAARAEAPDEIDASAVFCHSCGAQAGVSDRFCRRCGTRLRQ